MNTGIVNSRKAAVVTSVSVVHLLFLKSVHPWAWMSDAGYLWKASQRLSEPTRLTSRAKSFGSSPPLPVREAAALRY